MKKLITAAAGLAMAAGTAQAAGVERSSQSVGILFEKGRYAEFSAGFVSPSVSGTLTPPGLASGDMAKSYTNLSFGYKQELGENTDIAFIVDQPIGADVLYPAGTAYALSGTSATINSIAYTGLLRYRFPSNFSVYGGIRIQQVSGEASLPFAAYTLTTGQETDFGYVLGVAYEKPEIALRVALTYNSEITHKFENVLENGTASAPFSTTVPQSVNLEFQSGVAPDTLVFGNIRWVEWTAFDISPAIYVAGFGGPLSDYANDGITYNLGIGRRFNDQLSGAITFGYEPSSGDITGNLGPTDGYKSVGLGLSYTRDNVKVTVGVRYVKIGDATTTLGANFTDNHAVAAGMKIGVNF